MIGFRTDANEVAATGHLMRCIAMAQELISRGEQVMFFLAQEKETKRLQEKGIPYRILDTDWRQMEAELPVLKRIIAEEKLSFLVVDSYQATHHYLETLEQQVPVLYVDDMAAETYDISLALHYGDWLEDGCYLGSYSGTRTKALAGMQYVPLRKEFYPAPEEPEQAVLITTGGTDPYHISRMLVERMCREADFGQTDIHIVAGSMNRDMDIFQKLARENSRIHLHHNVSNMGNLMRQCSAAVSAGGTTLFELCACRIPSVCFSFADNQAEFTRQMGEHGVMLYAGDARENPENTAEMIMGQIRRIFKEGSLREKLAERMGSLVDGKGTERIAEAIVRGKR